MLKPREESRQVEKMPDVISCREGYVITIYPTKYISIFLIWEDGDYFLVHPWSGIDQYYNHRPTDTDVENFNVGIKETHSW